MQLVQLYILIDAAHDTIDELGKTGLVQFRDVSPAPSPRVKPTQHADADAVASSTLM